jgi:ribokinase
MCEEVEESRGARRPGGIAYNFAVSAAREGADAVLVSCVGTDAAGERLVASMKEVGLDSTWVTRLDGRSTTQSLRIDAGERCFFGYDAGVLTRLRLSTPAKAMLRRMDVLACADGAPALLADCMGLGVKVACDFSKDTDGNTGRPAAEWVGPLLDRLSLTFVGGSIDDVDALERLAASAPGPIVLTAGGHGAWAFLRGAHCHQPSLAREIVDTTGCGDAFQGAFTARHFAGDGLSECLFAGAQAAARIASLRGGQGRGYL